MTIADVSVTFSVESLGEPETTGEYDRSLSRIEDLLSHLFKSAEFRSQVRLHRLLLLDDFLFDVSLSHEDGLRYDQLAEEENAASEARAAALDREHGKTEGETGI